MTPATDSGSGIPPGEDFVLSPGARLLWRSPSSVHVELGTRSVIVDNLDRAVVARLVERDPAPSGPSAGRPPRDAQTREVLVQLAREGFLWARQGARGPDSRRLPPDPQLATELAGLAATRGELAAHVLAARRRCGVAIHGQGRVGPQLAAVLAAAGIGRVACVAAGSARLAHAGPGGLLPADEGAPFSTAAAAAVRRAAPRTDTLPFPPDDPPDLVVLAGEGPVGEDRRYGLHTARTAHLAITSGPEHGVVGPLVLPGLTSCLRCADLHRRDRDPAWPALAAQLSIPQRHRLGVDVAAAAITVGVAALQVLTFLDGGAPAAVDGTLEIRLPDWRVRRRSWSPHPACDCGLARQPTPRDTARDESGPPRPDW